MESEDENSAGIHAIQTNGAKKRRLQNACDECRRRKIKCDSAMMPDGTCTNCQSFKTECTHVTTKKKRGPPKGTPRGKRTIQSIVRSILSSSYNIPEAQSAIRDLLIDFAYHIQSLEEELAQARKELASIATMAETSNQGSESRVMDRLPSPRTSDSSTSDSGDKALEELSHQLTQLQLEKRWSSARHFGQSSNRVLVLDALDIKKEYTGIRLPPKSFSIGDRQMEFLKIHPWQLVPASETEIPFDFPEDDLMMELVSLYFKHVNMFIPVLHRPTLERSIAQSLHHSNRRFGAVVLTVCALGARNSNDPRVFLEGSTSGHSIGWKWIKQVALIRNPMFLEIPSLYDIQLYALYILFMALTSTAESSWILTGIGVRLAQAAGAHRQKTGPEQITAEAEVWKRAFWAIYMIDMIASVFLGRPRALSSDEFDVDLPIECDDEYWDHQDNNQAFKQPDGKPSLVSSFISLLKLLDILGMSQRTIYSVRRPGSLDTEMSTSESTQKAVLELDARLNEWTASLPEHLKWDPNRDNMDHLNQAALLHVVYYWIHILIHKPFISSAAKGCITPFPSLAICTNAARACCRVMEVQQYRAKCPLFPNITLSALFNSAIVLTLNVWREGRDRSWTDLDNAFSDVYRCMNMIRAQENRLQVAGRLFDTLSNLVSFTHSRSSSKRQRDEHEAEDAAPTGLDPGNAESNIPRVQPEPRKIAGSNRVSAVLDSQSQPQHKLPSGSSLFMLPRHSNDFGNLPGFQRRLQLDHASFSWPEGVPLPDASLFGPQYNVMLPITQTSGFYDDSYQVDSNFNLAGSGVGGELAQDSVLDNPQRMLMAHGRGLSMTASETGGHGSVDSVLYEAQAMTDVSAMGSNENSEWDDWGTYMADVDELLRAMNSAA